MKVYRSITTDIETGKVLAEDSFEYSGPVSLCKGDVNVPAAPPKSANELESEALNVEAQRLYIDRLKNPEAYYTENEKLLNQYSTDAIKSAIETAPLQKEYYTKQLEYMTQTLEYNAQQLQNVQTVKELSEYTGALSTEEHAMLDTIAQNAKDKITSTVNDQTSEIVSAKISELAARGVLNSSIATDLLGKVAETSQKAIAQGTTDVETARMQQELNIQQTNKDRALNWANYGLNRQQINSNLANMNSAALVQPLQTATQQSQYAAGLQQQWGNMGSTLGTNLQNIYSTERSAEANRALNTAIASSQASAAQGASWASLGGAGLGAAGMVGAGFLT